MNTIICKNCGEQIEISAALQGQIEAQVLAAEHKKHEAELVKVRSEYAAEAKKQIDAELALLSQKMETDLELSKKKLLAEAEAEQKKQALEQELMVKSLSEDAQTAKEESQQLREQLSNLMQALREERKAKDNAQLEAEKRLAAEEAKIREEVQKAADEKQRLNLLAKDKTIVDLQKALEAAQRKAAQGSQQLQGEILELDLESALAAAFRDDTIEPVAKGVRGGDIRQTVKSPRGMTCGSILWEIKRTKNWTDSWIPKLKDDLRNEKANVPIIVTEAMPKEITEDIGSLNGVWICKPQLAIVLGSLLRKSLLDAGLQKALADNRGTKADALYSFITSHEFVQQIEAMIETFQAMTAQIAKEKVAYARSWAEREAQVQRLFLGTANVIGSMQGHIGSASMPKIRGLMLDEGEDSALELRS